MIAAAVQTLSSLEPQPPLPVRRLHNFIYCPRLFSFQWVENIFQENADTVAGTLTHRNVDVPSKLDDPKELGLPEGASLRSLRLESESLGLTGVVDIVEGGPDGVEVIDYKKGSAHRIGLGALAHRDVKEFHTTQWESTDGTMAWEYCLEINDARLRNCGAPQVSVRRSQPANEDDIPI